MLNESKQLVAQEKLDLTKGNPGLTKVAFALGWDANKGNGGSYDLDAFAVLLGSDGKVLQPFTATQNTTVCFFNKLEQLGVKHSGDELTGASAGDDETITVEFSKLEGRCEQIVFFVNIFEAAKKAQHFGLVSNAFIRMYDPTTNNEIARYDLSEDFIGFSGVRMGRTYKHNGEWKFQADGSGFNGTITDAVNQYC